MPKTSRDALESAVLSAMQAASAHPMAWGVDDCALWCADILKSVVGYDAAERFRGRYHTRIGARRVLGKSGLVGALRVASRRHKWQRIIRGDEQPGDVGIAVVNGVSSTVICRAPGWFIGRNDAGWTALQSKYVRLMWSVV